MRTFFMTPRSNLLIAVLLLPLAVIAAGALPALAKNNPRAGTVRTKVEKLGAGAHVMVKTRAGQELHGHIESVGRESFTLRPDNNGSERQIAFNQVLQVRKNPARNNSLNWFLIGAAAATFVIVIALIA